MKTMACNSLCLVCLIGLPASGKSTLALNIEAHFKLKYYVEIITFDKEILWKEENSWKSKRKNVQEKVAGRIEMHLKLLNKPALIILDDNMFYSSMRYEYFQLARSFKIGFCEIYLCTSLDVCLSLNSKRDKPVDENTIINMNHKLEIPDPCVNKWEKDSMTIVQNLSEIDWLNMEKMFHYCLQMPVSQVERLPKRKATRSTLHLADIALRRIVNSLVKGRKITCENFECYGLELTKKRQQVMEMVRSGDVVLPVIDNNEENCILLYSETLKPYFWLVNQ